MAGPVGAAAARRPACDRSCAEAESKCAAKAEGAGAGLGRGRKRGAEPGGACRGANPGEGRGAPGP